LLEILKLNTIIYLLMIQWLNKGLEFKCR